MSPNLPSPRTRPVAGHLGRWGRDPLDLLEEGARLGEPFELRLWRRTLVGFRPAWNRRVLGDLDTFRSRGSLSGLSPYLAGGVVLTDAPRHAERRAELNPHVHARALAPMRAGLEAALARVLPTGRFDALAWSLGVMPTLLNEAFFAGRFPPELLVRFLSPLHGSLPGPLLPRPLLFRRVTVQIERLLEDPPEDALAGHLGHVDRAAEELRIALAAAFDTTAHTLAWALWHVASEPAWRTQEVLPRVIKETLRLHPAGWLGSRVSSRPFEYDGRSFPAGRLVFYSPYLTHRDPDLWPDPLRFDPARFEGRPPAWGYLPFSAGERICLGMHLANLMLEVALTPFIEGDLRTLEGDTTPRTGLTLSPTGPLWLEWRR